MHVAVLGDAGCGKTNLIRGLVGLDYEDDSPATDARTSYTQALSAGKDPLIYVDCGPIEDEFALRDLLSNADMVILAYDCTDRATFESVQSVWLGAVRACLEDRQVLVVLVGCKTDEPNRQVSSRIPEAVSVKERVLWIEVSARDGSNIDRLAGIIQSTLLETTEIQIEENESPSKPAMLRIHRTGSVDLTAQASGVSLHLTRDGALIPSNGATPAPADLDSVFPLLVDVRTPSGQLGTIIVRARNDDPLILAENFLVEHGMDKRRSPELASIIQRRLDEYFKGMRAPNPQVASPGMTATTSPSLTKKPQEASVDPLDKNRQIVSNAIASPDRITSKTFETNLVSNRSSLQEQQQQKAIPTAIKDSPYARPPPPPLEEETESAGRSLLAQSALNGKPKAILARINVSVSSDIQTVVAVREGDDAARVVEAFRRTYGLAKSDPLLHKLLDQVLQILREGVALDDTVLVEGTGATNLPYADSPLGSIFSAASRGMPSPPERLRSVPEEEVEEVAPIQKSISHQNQQPEEQSVTQAAHQFVQQAVQESQPPQIVFVQEPHPAHPPPVQPPPHQAQQQSVRARAILVEKHVQQPRSRSDSHVSEDGSRIDPRLAAVQNPPFVDSPIAPVGQPQHEFLHTSAQMGSPPSFIRHHHPIQQQQPVQYEQEEVEYPPPVFIDTSTHMPVNPPPPPPSRYSKPSPVPYRGTGSPQRGVSSQARRPYAGASVSPAVRSRIVEQTTPVRAPTFAHQSPLRRVVTAPMTNNSPNRGPLRRTAAVPAVSPARPVISTSTSPVRSGRRPQTRPLFYVDVNLGGKSERVAVHKGDNLKEVAEDFLERHNISKTKTLKLTQLLEYHMRIHVNKTRQQRG